VGNFLKSIWEIPVKFLSGGDEKVGPFTWNLTEEKLKITPGLGVGADSKGIIFNGNEDIVIGASSVHIDVDPSMLKVGDYEVNSLATEVASTPISPMKVFEEDASKYLYIAILAQTILTCLDDMDRKEYNQKTVYTHEVIDYDSFQPS